MATAAGVDADERFDALVEARRQWEEHALGEPLSMQVATSVIHPYGPDAPGVMVDQPRDIGRAFEERITPRA